MVTFKNLQKILLEEKMEYSTGKMKTYGIQTQWPIEINDNSYILVLDKTTGIPEDAEFFVSTKDEDDVLPFENALQSEYIQKKLAEFTLEFLKKNNVTHVIVGDNGGPQYTLHKKIFKLNGFKNVTFEFEE